MFTGLRKHRPVCEILIFQGGSSTEFIRFTALKNLIIFYSLSNPSCNVGTLHAIGLAEQSVHPSVSTSFVEEPSLTSTLKCPTALSLENPASSCATRSSIIDFSSINYTYSFLLCTLNISANHLFKSSSIPPGNTESFPGQLLIQIKLNVSREYFCFLTKSVRNDCKGI